jgi:hypothetical protein
VLESKFVAELFVSCLIWLREYSDYIMDLRRFLVGAEFLLFFMFRLVLGYIQPVGTRGLSFRSKAAGM